MFERSEEGCRQGWFVTTLSTEVVRSLLVECRVPIPPESIEVHLFRDTVLGITVGRIHTDISHEDHVLDIAHRAHERCAVEELVLSVTGGG